MKHSKSLKYKSRQMKIMEVQTRRKGKMRDMKILNSIKSTEWTLLSFIHHRHIDLSIMIASEK